ncbi:MAG: AAA family ATPase [Clostridium sp.]|uniref:DEAD/DEAH box helicase n=1 Tax=Clostridium sp. TaxID=1506 RepID=UPI0029106997|nr:ATP-binding domain-containing protein [Clostridium sp.]MDU5210556.1 AAA family ATPase [Clostridium sp.]MDU6762095.1 AAA family ATPase [Clostridium sp.]
MSDGFFYCQVEKCESNKEFLEKVERFSEENLKQTYVIDKPLGEKKYNYKYKDAIVLLIPKYKIIFIDFNEERESDEFLDYIEDFIEDLGYISDKYEYKKILGRPRVWKEKYFEHINYEDIKNKSIEEVIDEFKLNIKEEERNGEFIISLLTGSINDVDRLGKDYPKLLLDKIKQKIILFDGDQTKFIYQEPDRKRITIQGLAGTGKTELLLHKLKDLYVNDKDTKIVFTCHNRILAESLKIRIPEFFNFMKVQEQIKWNERLWAINGWGSGKDKNSGLYSYICSYYNIPFERYNYNTTFDSVCKRALDNILKLESFSPCFDYILIDESQDFTESFFRLCEKVTKNTVYIAGDIFQNVFDEQIVSNVTPDFLLNKCYRTDAKTLMFAHALGMGLFEEKLRWLTDEEWEACGYIIDKKNGNYNLSRKPLRRFEDLSDKDIKSIKLISSENENYTSNILDILEEIVNNNPTVKPDDIGIIFLENININYQLTNKLEMLISKRFGWDINIGYETKTKIKNTLFISNRNNVKGLEFPFVICIMQSNLRPDLQQRNSIYMMLTRSFITTYFIIPKSNGDLVGDLQNGINAINETGVLTVKEPSEREKERLRNAIINKNKINQSHYDYVEEIMDEISITKDKREKLHKMIEYLCKDEFDRDKIREIIQVNATLI